MSEIEVESFRIKGFLIKDIIKEDFIKDIESTKISIDPVALIFMTKTDKTLFPISIGHRSSKDVEEKIVHIESLNSKALNKFVDLIKKRISK